MPALSSRVATTACKCTLKRGTSGFNEEMSNCDISERELSASVSFSQLLGSLSRPQVQTIRDQALVSSFTVPG